MQSPEVQQGESIKKKEKNKRSEKDEILLATNLLHIELMRRANITDDKEKPEWLLRMGPSVREILDSNPDIQKIARENTVAAADRVEKAFKEMEEKAQKKKAA
jgi:hypothetical protein